ncbi:MAG: XdhC family protein [Spirochaetaceae bacterium]|jgi:xanthine dehydrogenase accessory factor|nr:XdhC family protein [Spirochaetaceae bacterium]
MKGLLTIMLDELRQKQPLVLVTIVGSTGSTPRGAGSRMVVGAHGCLYGTIGGGISEHLAEEEAKTLIQEKRSQIRTYTLHPSTEADIGAVCGGDVQVHLQYLDPEDAGITSVIETALGCFSAQENLWLVHELGSGPRPACLGLVGAAGPVRWTGSVPHDPKAFLTPQGTQIRQGKTLYFCDPLVRASFVYVFGAGHVAQELVPLLTHVGFRCIVFDDRENLLGPQRFPDAEKTLRGDFAVISSQVGITEEDYVVIVTRSHTCDFQATAFALGTQARYIGIIGSQTKLHLIREKLRAMGFSPELIAAKRVHAPIGLAIKSETPAEIAVSIAGEMILARASSQER